MPDGSEWLAIAERFGVPVVLLGGLAWATWRALKWIANEVLKPVTARHIQFIDTMQQTIQTQTQQIGSFAESHGRVAEAQEKIAEQQQVTSGSIERLAVAQERLVEDVRTAVKRA